MQGFVDSRSVTVNLKKDVKDRQIQKVKQHIYKIILYHSESVQRAVFARSIGGQHFRRLLES